VKRETRKLIERYVTITLAVVVMGVSILALGAFWGVVTTATLFMMWVIAVAITS